LQGSLTGMALPRYMLDIPGGKGKIPIDSSFIKNKGGREWEVESPFGERCVYLESDTIDDEIRE
jgi:lysine 2,3-aminomutase